MTTPSVVDYSFNHPDPAGMYAAGVRTAGRYLGPGEGSKLLSISELADLRTHNVGRFYLVEGNGHQDVLQGFPMGAQHAQLALDHAAQLGINPRAFYCAVDYQAPPGDYPTIQSYLSGFASKAGRERTGVYGGFDLVQHMHMTSVASWAFQTYAWSGGFWYPGAHVRQYLNDQPLAGGEVDYCQAMAADFGQDPSPQETDVTPEEHDALMTAQAFAYGCAHGAETYWLYDHTKPDGRTSDTLKPFYDRIAKAVGQLPGNGGTPGKFTISLTGEAAPEVPTP